MQVRQSQNQASVGAPGDVVISASTLEDDIDGPEVNEPSAKKQRRTTSRGARFTPADAPSLATSPASSENGPRLKFEPGQVCTRGALSQAMEVPEAIRNRWVTEHPKVCHSWQAARASNWTRVKPLRVKAPK